MKHLQFLMLAVFSFVVSNTWSQQTVVPSRYVFTYMMEYSGFDNNIHQKIKYRIYWTPGDYHAFAYMVSDETGRFVSFEILDRLNHNDIFIDLREKQGFLSALPEFPVKLEKLNLTSTENLDTGKFFISREYLVQSDDKVFHYWIALKSPAVDSVFAFLNSFGLKFITYPQGQEYIVTKFKENQGDSTLSWFDLTGLKKEGYFVFDLRKYRILDRRY